MQLSSKLHRTAQPLMRRSETATAGEDWRTQPQPQATLPPQLPSQRAVAAHDADPPGPLPPHTSPL